MSQKPEQDGAQPSNSISSEEKSKNITNKMVNLSIKSAEIDKKYSKNDKHSPRNLHHRKDEKEQPVARNNNKDRNHSANGYVSDTKHDKSGHHSIEPLECNPPKTVLADLEKEYIYPLKKKSVRFPNARFFCRLCEYHCDTVDICRRHSQDSRHLYMKEMKILENTLKNFPPPTDVQHEVITELIESIAREQSITEEEICIRKEIKDELEKLLQEDVPGLSLEISGSTLSGFALKSSNLDIDVLVPDDTKSATSLLAVLKLFGKSDIYCDLVNDLYSSYPCLSCTHKKTGVRMVVGISSPAARDTNLLLSYYNAQDIRVKPFITAFRYWAKLCQIDNQQGGTLSAHCFPLMAVHFLQQCNPPILPVLQPLKTPEQPDNCRAVYQLDPSWKSENNSSLGKLWVALFHFYAIGFKLSSYVINIRSVCPMVRKERTWGKRIAIEDPFQTKRNLARTVSSPQVFDYIINRFKATYRYFVTPQLQFGQLFKQVQIEGGRQESLRTSPNGDTSSAKEDAEESDMLEMKVAEKPEFELDEDEEFSEDDDDDSLSGEVEEEDELKRDGAKHVRDFEEESPSPVSYGCDMTSASKDTTSESSLHEDCQVSLSDIVQPLNTVPLIMAKALMAQLKKEQLQYRFNEQIFTGGKKVPLFCCACQKSGHDKTTCKEDELPPLKSLPVLQQSYYNSLSSIFLDLLNTCAPTPQEIDCRDYIVSELQAYIRQFFAGAVLKLFGSSANGFGFGHSDLDICLTFQGHATGEHLDYIEVIEEIAEKLKKFRQCRQVLAITTAKVPIVKFTVRRAQLEADLSLYNTLALQNTQLLNTYANIDPRVKVLGYGMKYFAKLCDMGDASRGSLSSYAYILMVIHFLQQCNPPVVPVLQKLFDPNLAPPERIIDGWNAWFFDDLKNLPRVWKEFGKNTQSTGELWVNMLRYYTETFNWKDNVVTIRQLQPLARLEKLWMTQCIAIEDPFDLSHNLGAGLSRKMNTFIMKAFIRGREVFGYGYEAPPPGYGYRNLIAFLFDIRQLTDGAPPNDRGCRLCGKIGHVVRECPRKKQKREPKKNSSDSPSKKDDKENLASGERSVVKEKEERRENHNALGPKARDKVLHTLPKGLVVAESTVKPIGIQKENVENGAAANDPKGQSSDRQRHSSYIRGTDNAGQVQPESNVSSTKTTISPAMLFQMAHMLQGGPVHMLGSVPLKHLQQHSQCSTSGSPALTSVPPYGPAGSYPQSKESALLAQIKENSVTSPPPGFAHPSHLSQRSSVANLENHTTCRSFVTASPHSVSTLSAPNSAPYEAVSRMPQCGPVTDQMKDDASMQMLNAVQRHHQQQLHLQQQQQLRLQEQQHLQLLLQLKQQQPFFLPNQQLMKVGMQQQQTQITQQSEHLQHPSQLSQPQLMQRGQPSLPVDGKAFISHLMSQVPGGIVPIRLPQVVSSGFPPPPPGLTPRPLPQVTFPVSLPVSQQQFTHLPHQLYQDIGQCREGFLHGNPASTSEKRVQAVSPLIHPAFRNSDLQERHMTQNKPGDVAYVAPGLTVSSPSDQKSVQGSHQNLPTSQGIEGLPSDFFYIDENEK